MGASSLIAHWCRWNVIFGSVQQKLVDGLTGGLGAGIVSFLAKVWFGIGILIVQGAVIADPALAQSTLLPKDNVLIGTWREQLKLGSMIVEFTDSTMSFSSADRSGQLISNSTHVAHVHYRKLDQTIAIDFDEQGGGGFLAAPQDATHILLDFPGMGAHHLEKVK
jgi:hypothetical protein